MNIYVKDNDECLIIIYTHLLYIFCIITFYFYHFIKEFASVSLDNQLRVWDLKLTIPSIIHIINAGPGMKH